MMRRPLLFAACLLSPVLAAAVEFNAANATNQLGIDLFRQLAKATPTGNLVISPYSIDSALALAYSGADGATRTEMAGALRFPADDAALRTSFGALRASLDELTRASAAQVAEVRQRGGDAEAIVWYQANLLFGQQGYAFLPSFLALMRDGYDAPFQTLDFKHYAETARDTINIWVESQTQQKIRGLIPRDALDDKTRLILVNACYLKAPWQDPFKTYSTEQLPFHLSRTDAPKVPTMRQTAALGYMVETDCTAVALDYAGGGVRFLILLPNENTTCEALLAKLTPARFRAWAALGKSAHPDLLELYLPKFEVHGASLAMGNALRALGIRRAFDQPPRTADFSRIAPRQPDDYLKLAEVFHQTFIAVDEEGTEAAAASAVLTMTTLGIVSSPPKPLVVRVDRPFLFAIQHRASGACLFLGRITDPR